MTRRRGYSLVEMLFVMSALAVVFGLCVSLIFMLIRLDKAGRARVTQAVIVERLARQFRQDARAATKGNVLTVKNDNVGGIELDQPGDVVVEYRRSGTNVERIRRGGNTPMHHDLYRLDGRERATIEVRDEDGQDWAVLALPDWPRPGPAEPGPRGAGRGPDRQGPPPRPGEGGGPMTAPIQRKAPRGVAIVPVLVCFVLILLMMTVVLKIALAQRARLQGEERRLQAEWLAEAGLDRAGRSSHLHVITRERPGR